MTKEIPIHDTPQEAFAAIDQMGAYHDMRRSRPYDGQSWTDQGERGKTEVKGVTFRDLRDCLTRAVATCAHDQAPLLSAEADKGEHGCICDNDLYGLDLNKLDIIAVFQTFGCEVERLMGIFPNVPEGGKEAFLKELGWER